MVTKLNILSLLILGIPETLALTIAAFAFSRISLSWSRIIPVGFAMGLTIYAIRMLPLHFGFHTLFILLALAIFTRIATNVPLSTTLKSATVAVMILVASEFLMEVIVSFFLPALRDGMQANNLLWLLLGWPPILIVLAVGVYSDYRNRRLPKKSYIHVPGEKTLPRFRR